MGYSTRRTTPSKPIPAPEPEREALAIKIAEIVVDRVNAEIIRPGPETEERECYDVARELRAFTAELAVTVYRMLEVHEQEGTAPIPDVIVRGVSG